MSKASGRVPLSLSDFLERTKLTGKPVPATESIRNAAVRWQLIEDYRPILGQNSLVIMVGFADLMDALTAEGGATVRVG